MGMYFVHAKQVRFNAIDWKVSLRLHCTMYVLRKEISLTTIWNFLYKAPLTGVFLQVHYSYLWSSFAAKKIYQEHEKKSKYINSVRSNICFVCKYLLTLYLFTYASEHLLGS